MSGKSNEQGKQHQGRWLAQPATPAQAELRQALDQAVAREADEVALRRVWARLAELPELVPSADLERERGPGHLDDLAARRVRWPWIVAASLAGATATLTFMLIETKSEFRAERAAPALVSSANSVAAGGGPGTASGMDQRSTLVAPATVRTGFGETLHLSLRGGTQATVTSESTLVLDNKDRPAVTKGEVQFHVPRQPPGQTFAVAAGDYRVVVVGTRFHVRVNQSNAGVDVDEGVVEIWTDHRIARVAAGESWVGPTVGPTENVKDAPPSHPTLKPSATRGSLRSGARGAGASRGLLAPKALGDGGQAVLALSSPGGARTTSALSRPLSGAAPARAAAPPSSTASKEIAAPFPLVPEPSPSPPAPPAVSPAGGDTTPLAVQARAARAAGDPRRALGLYRALAQKGGAAGENAEYEIARLLRDALHQPREAVASWRLYRAQHPRGLLRIEADISVIETLTSLGDKTGALAEASDFIRRYPDSERRAEIARLAGDLHRERGSCADAVEAYEVALASGHGRRDVLDGATFHRAVCLLRSGTPAAEGAAALQAYLVAFPAGRFRAQARRLLNGSADSALER